jgi:lipopolysaccharide/colanic/teichoic acid biosynthesis glycosyltransferase
MDRSPIRLPSTGETRKKLQGANHPNQVKNTVPSRKGGSTYNRTKSLQRGSLCPRGVYNGEHSMSGLSVRADQLYVLEKRILDIAACVLAAPLILPLVLFCVITVRCSSPGPVFFRQKRIGRGGHPFEMLKFRSMVVDAEAQKAALKKTEGITGPDFKMQDDPRITRFGALMRKTSLDELPQLWNVLKGDMSLVGPRPTSFGVETYQRWHAERLEVKPGLTGLWQIRARGDLDFDSRVRLDIAYVRQRSLLLDLWILLCTAPSVISQRGAY